MKKTKNTFFEDFNIVTIIAGVVGAIITGGAQIIAGTNVYLYAVMLVVYIAILLYIFVVAEISFTQGIERRIKESIDKSMVYLTEDTADMDKIRQLINKRPAFSKKRLYENVYILNELDRKLKNVKSNYTSNEKHKIEEIQQEFSNIWQAIKLHYAKNDKMLCSVVESIIIDNQINKCISDFSNENINYKKDKTESYMHLSYEKGEEISGGNGEKDFTDVLAKNDRDSGRISVFYGDGGFGKTWTLKRIASLIAENERKSKESGSSQYKYIPIFVESRKLQSNIDTPVWAIINSTLNEGFSLGNENIVFDVDKSFVVFLDALDEATGDSTAERAVNELASYECEKYISTRNNQMDLFNNLAQYGKANKYKIKPIDSSQVIEYLRSNLSEVADHDRIIEEFKNKGIINDCNTPYLLKCFISLMLSGEDAETDQIIKLLDDKNKLFSYFVLKTIERETNHKALSEYVGRENEIISYLSELAGQMLNDITHSVSRDDANALAKEFVNSSLNPRVNGNDLNVILVGLRILSFESGRYSFYTEQLLIAMAPSDALRDFLKDSVVSSYSSHNFVEAFKQMILRDISEGTIKNMSSQYRELSFSKGGPMNTLIILTEALDNFSDKSKGQQLDNIGTRALIELILFLFRDADREEHTLKTEAYPKLGEYIMKTLVELIDDNPGQYAYGGVDDIIESIYSIYTIRKLMFGTPEVVIDVMDRFESEKGKMVWTDYWFGKYQRAFNSRVYNWKYPKFTEKVCLGLIEKLEADETIYKDRIKEIADSIKWHQENDSKRDSSMASKSDEES